MAGLTSYGITPHHRKSFCRISDLLLELEHQTELDDLEQRVLDDVGVPDEEDLDDEMIAAVDLDIDDLSKRLEPEL